MNIPQLRFPEFKGEWERKKLGEVAEINPSNKSLPETFIYIDLESVSNGELLKENQITKDEAPSRAQRILKENDILFQMVRPYQMNNLFFNRNGDYVASTGYAQIRTQQNSKFVFQYLHFQKFVDKVIERCTGTSYPAINSTDLSNIELSFPTLPEQTKIANFLTAVDEKIQALKKKQILLEQYKKGVMQKLFSQELRFKDENGNDFPDWEVKKFGEVLESISTKKYQIKATEFKVNGKYKVIDQGQDLIAGYSDSENNVFKNLPVIVFGDHTTILKFIDFSFIVGADGTKLLKSRNNDDLKYLFYNLEYNNVKQEGYKRHYTMLSEAYLQIPTLPEQTKIANFLSSIDEKINHTKTQIEKMQEWKKGLLQQMFV